VKEKHTRMEENRPLRCASYGSEWLVKLQNHSE